MNDAAGSYLNDASMALSNGVAVMAWFGKVNDGHACCWAKVGDSVEYAYWDTKGLLCVAFSICSSSEA